METVESVRLCAEGMQAEAEGRASDAHGLFRQAWYAATDDYEACVAAHYLARHQSSPEDTLRWNQECLDRADKVGDERVRGFYPSMHLNMARAYEELGDRDKARAHFQRTASCLDDAPAGPYRDGIRFATAAGLRSTGDARSSPALAELMSRLCARADLTALGLLLPPFLGDLGTQADRTALLTALHMVHVDRALPADEQEVLRRAISELTDDAR
jgi:hypothetical protein